jgi:predicted protein tyrosine phosphatase
MSIKKTLQWTFIFLILVSYTWLMISSVFTDNTMTVYASAIAEDEYFQQSAHFVLMQQNNPAKTAFQRLAQRFQKQLDNEAILCSASPDEFSLLNEQYDLDVRNMNIDGREVAIANAANTLFRHDLNSNAYCINVKAFQPLILAFTAQLS